MRMPMALTVSGLAIAGGFTFAAVPANAATAQEKAAVSSQSLTYGETVAMVPDNRPRCRHYVRGHWTHMRGRSVYVHGYWLPRGCRR